MVVTFLLVIMSAAVMTLSQRVVQNFKEQLVAQQKHSYDQPNAGKGAPALSAANSSGQQLNRIVSPESEAGSSIAELGSILKSDTAINGRDQLSIRTRETQDELKLQVKAMEQPDSNAGVQVQTADALIRVDFEPMAVNFDADNASKLIGFLKGKAQPGMTYEIWSFAPQTSSQTEAQRLSYYRAAMTRNILIRAGIAPADIQTQIRVTDATAKDGHNVRVVLKP